MSANNIVRQVLRSKTKYSASRFQLIFVISFVFVVHYQSVVIKNNSQFASAYLRQVEILDCAPSAN